MADDAEPEEPGPQFRVKICLHIDHPNAKLDAMTEALGLAPRRVTDAGTPRHTPAGEPLSGVYARSPWFCEMSLGREIENDLDDSVMAVLSHLAAHRPVFRRIRDEGGGANLTIGWFFNRPMSGGILCHQAMRLAGELQVDLAFYTDAPD